MRSGGGDVDDAMNECGFWSNFSDLLPCEKRSFVWHRTRSFGGDAFTICIGSEGVDATSDGNDTADVDATDDDDDALDDSDNESDDNNEDDDEGECNNDGAMENSHKLYGELVMVFMR